MLLALVQMAVKEKNKQANIDNALNLLRNLKDDVDVAVLPEVWTTGYSLGALHKEAEKKDANLLKMLSDIAKERKMNIVAGSMAFRREDNKFYNTTFVFDRAGNIVCDYDKIHMFSLYDEQKYFSPGSKMVMTTLDDVSCGLAICYDLRFPEMFRQMAIKGAKLVFLPAQWPTLRGDVWRLLIQARAVEDQVFMCAVNCTGEFKGQPFYGHSMIVAPNGKIIVEADENQAVIYAKIDLELVDKTREKMSVLKDVREELYKI